MESSDPRHGRHGSIRTMASVERREQRKSREPAATDDLAARSRGFASEEVARLSTAIEGFLWDTEIAQRQLAEALGLHRTELSPSHIGERGPLLAWVLRRAALPEIAIRLRLDPTGYRA